jgi:hypothetical protein
VALQAIRDAAPEQGGSRGKRGKPSLCPHQRIRSKCKECGGSSICQHQRRRSQYKECGGASICREMSAEPGPAGDKRPAPVEHEEGGGSAKKQKRGEGGVAAKPDNSTDKGDKGKGKEEGGGVAGGGHEVGTEQAPSPATGAGSARDMLRAGLARAHSLTDSVSAEPPSSSLFFYQGCECDEL